MSILTNVQTILDTLLFPDDVYSYWQTYQQISGDANPDEYVVFTFDGLDSVTYADNSVVSENATVTVRYYYSPSLLSTATGRNKVLERMDSIVAAMRDGGFGTSTGFYDVGDVDDVGKNTAICVFVGDKDG